MRKRGGASKTRSVAGAHNSTADTTQGTGQNMAVINGTSGNDVIAGQTLQDQINGYGGHDMITGGEGDDTIYGSAGDDWISGSGGNDLIIGGTGDDRIADGDGNDEVFAGEGDDLLLAGNGDDIFSGGKGFDTIDFSAAATGVTVDMHRGTVTGQGNDTIKDFEKIIATDFADNIRGSSGDDVIEAGGGKNIIRGGAGNDDMTGGDRSDTFVWKSSDVVDQLTGDSRGVDTIHGYESNDVLDVRSLLKGVAYTNLDEVVHFTDTSAGTMLQVKMSTGFVNVALLADVHLGGPSPAAYAADGVLLA